MERRIIRIEAFYGIARRVTWISLDLRPYRKRISSGDKTVLMMIATLGVGQQLNLWLERHYEGLQEG